MREIKFRFWDGSQMLENKDISYIDFNNKFITVKDKYHDTYKQIDFTKGTLMEYTGLNDITGKEIYEGDIVKVTDLMPCEKYYGKTYICKIVYDKDRFIIENYRGSGSNRISEKESFNFKSIEVIGNVFENEELLEVKSYERD